MVTVKVHFMRLTDSWCPDNVLATSKCLLYCKQVSFCYKRVIRHVTHLLHHLCKDTKEISKPQFFFVSLQPQGHFALFKAMIKHYK